MAKYEITAPDGSKWEVTAPESATESQVLSYAQKQWATAQPAAPQREQGTRNNNLGAQVGLTARAGLQGLGGLVGMVTDPIGGAINAGTPANFPKMQTLRATASNVADAIGLPTPDTPTQRVVGQATELMTGAGAGARAFSTAANSAGPAAKSVLQKLGANPLSQATAAGAGGAGGQQAKESGAGPVAEFASALAGTLLGAAGASGFNSTVQAANRLIPQQKQIELSRIQAVIENAMNRGGIDPKTITPAMQRDLQEKLRAAMSRGNLNEDAVARLMDYQRLGLTPTRASLTLDPFDITQERNASKVAAAMGARDAKLPAIAQENNQKLLSRVDGFEPSSDTFALGETVKAPIVRKDAAWKATEKQLYDNAKNMAGGDIPLERGALNDVYKKLSDARKLRFVPEKVMGTIDDILNDTRAPFTVNEIDSLKSTIATAVRGTQDGNEKAALKIIRDHLDSIPLTPEKRQFGGNQVVTSAGAKFLRDQDAQAGNVKEALDRARSTAFQRRQWGESAPIIEDALADATGETFIRNHVLSPSAGFKNLSKAVNVINSDPNAKQAIRAAIVQHLKDGAIGAGNGSATGNFSAPGWQSRLQSIGDRKLGLFFDADEVETLKAMGRVGRAETYQPRGSAVNNSNTAAGVAGLLQGITKGVKPIADKMPLGNALLTDPLQNITLSVMQRGATNVPNALLMPGQTQQVNPLNRLMLPAALTGSLFAQ